MHVYRKTREEGSTLFTVGYYIPGSVGAHTPQWVALEDTSDEAEARALVNYLNGGQGYLFRYATEK